MRRSLPVLCAAVLVLSGIVAVGTTPAGATDEPPATDSSVTDTAAPDTAAPDTEVTESSVTTTTMATAGRGSQVQLVPTLPPPTTTTLPKPPPPNPLAVPANSGAGRRVVYSKSRMRVWVIEANGTVTRTYLVSGRFNQPNLGTYHVFSRSSYTCNINHPNTCMRWMVRFAKGPSGDNIGFHEIPRTNGVPLQSDSQLGQALSSGCVRQSTADAMFMWGWAGIGTTVVVIW